MSLSEDRDASRSNQEADDDEGDARYPLVSSAIDDADNDEDHGEQPQHECHGEGITPNDWTESDLARAWATPATRRPIPDITDESFDG